MHQHHRNGTRWRHSWGARALLVASGVAEAQTSPPAWGGAENLVAPSVGLGSGGGVRSSTLYSLTASLGRTDLATASSSSYAMEGGMLASPSSIASWPPILFGTRSELGDKDGGEPVRVYGYGLSNLLDLQIGGVSVPAFGAVKPNYVDVTTPVGTNAYGNPFGRVDVAAFTTTGKPRRQDGFGYLPLIQEESVPTVGAPYRVRYLGEPGSFGWLFYGASVPGVAIPIAPFEGAVEALLGVRLFGLRFAPEGVADWTVNIPADPSLVGFLLEFQCLSITEVDLSAGEYTTLLQSPIQ